MQARTVDIYSLLTKALADDQLADELFMMHIYQGEVSEEKIAFMLTALKAEINKPDDICNKMALIMYAFLLNDDVELEIQLIDRAVALGSARAMHARAHKHEEGIGGPVNYPAAIALYDRAIALGCISSMNNRGYMYLYGRGGLVDYAEAIKLFERAIALGSIAAMCNRADMHRQSIGNPAYRSSAIELYDKAMEKGFAVAMLGRAMMFQSGPRSDFINAARLYRQATEAGNNESESRLVSMENSNIHIDYHIYMANSKPGIIPEKTIQLFKSHPEDVTHFILSDDLLTLDAKQKLLDFIGQHYLALASKALFDHDLAEATLLLNKVPENTSSYYQALSMGADTLYARLVEGTIEAVDSLNVLINIDALQRIILQQELIQLDKKCNHTGAGEDFDTLTSRMEQIDILLGSPKPISQLAKSITHHHIFSDAERNLKIYIERRSAMDDYAFLLREFLTTIYRKLTSKETTSLAFWQKPFSYHLRLIRNELVHHDPLPTATMATIQLASRVYAHIQRDPSDEAKHWVKLFPEFSQSLKRGIKRKYS